MTNNFINKRKRHNNIIIWRIQFFTVGRNFEEKNNFFFKTVEACLIKGKQYFQFFPDKDFYQPKKEHKLSWLWGTTSPQRQVRGCRPNLMTLEVVQFLPYSICFYWKKILNHIYSNWKYITIFIPDRILSTEYLFLKEYYGVVIIICGGINTCSHN